MALQPGLREKLGFVDGLTLGIFWLALYGYGIARYGNYTSYGILKEAVLPKTLGAGITLFLLDKFDSDAFNTGLTTLIAITFVQIVSSLGGKSKPPR
jgi:hypothetical protein